MQKYQWGKKKQNKKNILESKTAGESFYACTSIKGYQKNNVPSYLAKCMPRAAYFYPSQKEWKQIRELTLINEKWCVDF